MQRLKSHLSSQRESLISVWRERVLVDRRVESANHLSRTEFRDHIPIILQILEDRLVSDDNPVISDEFKVATQHGDQRWHQGYTVEEITREWNHLNYVVLAEIEEFSAHHFSHDERCLGIKARQIWNEIISEGLTQSAVRFDNLQKAKAKGNLRDMEAALERTKLFEQQRGVMLRQATHDIRGSLSVVRGATSLLDWHQIERLEEADRSNVLRILSNGVESLWAMMNEMLDLARLEAGVETLQIDNFDAGLTLTELGESVQTLANEKNLTLTIDGPHSLKVQGDAIKTRRIAQNLLLNSIKYTGSGFVEIYWSEPTEGRWQMEISDSGPGLSHGSIAPLLQQLEGTENTTVHQNVQQLLKEARGEGVGLSIVKHLCELCGATLQIESNERGSCFRVIFPTAYNNR